MALLIGMQSGQQDLAIRELSELWRFADQHGFDFISIWDHFYESPPVDGTHDAYEAISSMTLLATSTERVRVGCHVFCMSYRNPAMLAKAMATIDHISHGRVEVGLGAGWHRLEHRAYGYDFPGVKERLDRLEEGAQVMRAMFREQRANFEGQYYRIRDAMLYPRPVQSPIPIVIGGAGEKRTLRIAAKYADGWNVPYANIEEYQRLNGVLDQWCEMAGRDQAEIVRSANLHMHMGANAADAERIARERRGDLLTPAQVGGSLCGDPRQAIETLQAYEAAGASRVSVAVRPPIEWDALHAFAEEVIPAVKGSE